MSFAPIYSPPVPYRGYLPMAPATGSSVTVIGVVPAHCKRFAIDLETDTGDIPFHFNPRFEGTNQVVRNTMTGQVWGPEDRSGPFPFYLCQPFQVTVHIEAHHYTVSVNGQHFTQYTHRSPKDYVRVLAVKGDVQITQIRFEGAPVAAAVPGISYPPPPAYSLVDGMKPVPFSYPGAAPPAFYNSPPLPFNGPIPGGMAVQRMIKICGVPHYTASRFTVNLVCGDGYFIQTGKFPADIGLQLSVHMNDYLTPNCLKRNHRVRGGLGTEERLISFFPFMPSAPFELIIRSAADKYMIAINNQHLIEFRHRISLKQVDHLAIEGDIVLNSVQFQ